MKKIFDRIAEQISMVENLRKKTAENVRKDELDIFGRKFIKKMNKKKVNGKVSAVDGGLLARELHGCDLVLVRSVSAVFEYENGKLRNYWYWPEPNPEPSLESMVNGLALIDFSWHQNIVRLKSEIKTATETIKKFEPKLMLLDGSLVPQIQDRPADTSVIRKEYDELIDMYKKMYKTAKDKNCMLASVIKDCRGKRIVEMLKQGLDGDEKKVLNLSNDTLFLQYLLKEGERTSAVLYSKDWAEHPILKDLQPWSSMIHIMYLQATEMDRPLRVEFLGDKEEEVADTVYSLSDINKRYAYPAVLIEADLRAALQPIEMERVYRSLFGRLGNIPTLMNLKRNSRPFR